MQWHGKCHHLHPQQRRLEFGIPGQVAGAGAGRQLVSSWLHACLSVWAWLWVLANEVEPDVVQQLHDQHGGLVGTRVEFIAHPIAGAQQTRRLTHGQPGAQVTWLPSRGMASNERTLNTGTEDLLPTSCIFSSSWSLTGSWTAPAYCTVRLSCKPRILTWRGRCPDKLGLVMQQSPALCEGSQASAFAKQALLLAPALAA